MTNEDENVVDPSHPRYESLMIRKKVADAGAKGMLADSAMIAHGRGEAFRLPTRRANNTFGI